MLPLLMLTLEVESLSIHSLKSLFHILVKFEQNYMVETTWNFELFDKKKKKKKRFFMNHFWQSADAILEDIPGAETIV